MVNGYGVITVAVSGSYLQWFVMWKLCKLWSQGIVLLVYYYCWLWWQLLLQVMVEIINAGYVAIITTGYGGNCPVGSIVLLFLSGFNSGGR